MRPSRLAVCLTLGLAACTAPVADTSRSPEAEVIEVFTNYREADADAFREVLAGFTEQTGVEVRHVGTAALAARLPERVREGDPPDVALVPQPALVADLARGGHLRPAEQVGDLDDVLLPGAATIGLVDGVRYGVWYRLSVKSLVWYPPAAFADAGYGVPATWDELLRLTRRIQADGTAPWCLGMESFDATGWVGTDWIEDLVLRLHGPEVYDDWSTGRIPFTDDRIRQAFESFGDIALHTGSVLGGTRAILSVPVMDAVLPALEDPPRCLLSRQGSAQIGALPEGTDVAPDGALDVFVLPGVSEDQPAPLVASGEIAVAFNDRPGTQQLLAYLADPAAGAAWATRGGFTSLHRDFDPTAYTEPFDRRIAQLISEAEVVRFDASDQMPTAIGTGSFWTGIVDYVAGTPLDQVLQHIDAVPR